MSTIAKNENKSIKVKVFYHLRGSKSTRLTTFTLPAPNDDTFDLASMPIPLKTCLWSICSSSPDVICRDHDLSVYTASFHESGHGPSERSNSLIWEGHGLLSWIMDQSKDELFVRGKSGKFDLNIDVYIELQPTMKWIKDDFFSALRNQSFEQFRLSTLSPIHPICNCYNNHHNDIQRTITASPPSSQHQHKGNETEFDRYLRHRVQTSDSSPPLPSRLPSLSSVPVFRPEPIFPSSSTATTTNNSSSPPSTSTAKRSRLNSPLPESSNSRSFYKQTEELTLPIPSSTLPPYASSNNTSTNKKPDSANSRRSAFTIASLSDKEYRYLPSSSTSSSSSSASPPPSFSSTHLHAHNNIHSNSNNNENTNNSSKNYKHHHPPAQHPPHHHLHHPHQQQPRQHGMHDESNYQNNNGNSNSMIPVIYTPSNKKRKKNPAVVNTASSSSSNMMKNPSLMNADNHGNNGMYSQQHQQQQQQHQNQASHHSQQQQQQQQVNTVPRTYYEVDRDNQGAYILPVEIDSWTVVDLGTVIYDRPAYHNQRYIYPANYTVRKWYRSMIDPKSDTQYTCRILENGREPKFEVTADDCPMTYSGPTPTTVWTIIVRRAFVIRNQEYGHNPVGPDFFGLRKNTIAKMIQDLPNASKCSQYVWQTFEPARFNKPGRNRRRADSTLPGSLLGGVNYGLTSSRLIHNTNLRPTQHSYRGGGGTTPSSPPTQQQTYENNNEASSPTTTIAATEKNEAKSPHLNQRESRPIETA
ncbi:GTPase Ryh1 [Mucor velutinosus]|uniref:GTPase Ryh1 n=1 Tax=Mucor velutinosus TaxID=708070 RepID=A0AAN7DFJ0_9FUNG|nr:GTPase Ryh1 [Mucor velutinosus]